MHRIMIVVVVTIVSLLSMTGRATYSQSPDADGHRFEVGGQVSMLNSPMVRDVSVTSVVCVSAPCLPIIAVTGSRKIEPGLGGRIGYNLTDNLALEAELNFFPNADSFNPPAAFNKGSLIEGVFGLKAGKRFKKFGIFGKARPGFLFASKGDLRPITGSACIAISPAPAGCFETTSRNSFAFDLGGVVELYPSKRTLVRIDIGDTIIRMGQRNVTGIQNGPGVPSNFVVVVGVPAETTHNLQVGVGVGFRF